MPKSKKNNTPQRNNHKPNQGKKQQQKNKGKGKNQGNKQQGKKLPVYPAYEPKRVLEGKDLKRSIREQVQAAIKPTLRGINYELGSLGKEEGTALGKEANRGAKLVGNIGTYYEKLAQEETARLTAQQGASQVSVAQVAQAAQQAQQGLQSATGAISAGIGANETGQAISSREKLAQAQAEQQGQLAQQSQAQGAQAADSGQNWTGLLTSLAGASGMRGGEQISGASKGVQSGLNTIRNEFGKEKGKLKNAKLNLLLERPELAKKLYNEAIERERNYGLSRATLGLEKEESKQKKKESRTGIEYAKVAARENLKASLKKIKAESRKRSKELAELGASEKEKRESEHAFREQELAVQNEFQQQKNQFRKEELNNPAVTGGKGGNKPYEGYQTFTKTFSYLRGSPVKPQTLATDKKARKAAYDKLVNFGAPPKVAKAVIRKYIGQYKKGQVKKSVTSIKPF